MKINISKLLYKSEHKRWDCRGNQTLPYIKAFEFKVQLEYGTELHIARNSKNMKQAGESHKTRREHM